MKHIRIQISFVLLVFVIGLAFHQQVEAQDKIKSSVVGGGGVEPLTGTDYRIVAGTVGQPLVGQIGENKKEQVWNGFWYTQLAPPIADFTASKTEIKVGEEVTFTDKSRNRPTLWEWDLDGDGTVDEKYPTEKNPNKPNQLKFTYTASRVYSVTLKVTNLLGSSEKKIEIRVLGPPVAKFTANPISGTVPLIVTFKFVPNQPTNQPTSWKWDFGDGKTFDGENPPPHEYKDPGVYTVKLTVKNAIGEDSQTQVISTYIQAKQTFSLGQEISPPQGVDKSRLSPNPPKITITSNGKVIADPSDVENGYVFWHNETRTLYALKNGVTISTEWKDTQGSVLANVEATLFWPKEDSDYQIHVSGISVDLNPNKKFGWIKLTDTESSIFPLKQVDSSWTFNAQPIFGEKAGRTLLMFSTGNDPQAPKASISFKRVKTLLYTENLKDNVPATIGKDVAPLDHDAKSGAPYIFFEKSRYCKEIYDRAKRMGRVVPIDVNGNANEEKLVVVYYLKDADGIDWPYKPVRYIPKWSENPQVHVANTPLVDLNHKPRGKFGWVKMQSTETGTGASVSNEGFFSASGRGWSLIAFSPNDTPQTNVNDVHFKTVQTVLWNDPSHFLDDQPAVIGTEVLDTKLHDVVSCGSPYVFVEKADKARYAADDQRLADPKINLNNPGYYNRAKRTGPVIPVNVNGTTDEEKLVLVYYKKDADDICWPYKPVRYIPQWPTNLPNHQIIDVASGAGSSKLTLVEPSVYRQPYPELPGYNPNEEHAFILAGTVWASRVDLGSADTSEPYVLVKYKDTLDNKWKILVYQVIPPKEIQKDLDAGLGLEPRPPIANLDYKAEAVSGPYWQDRTEKYYARNAGIGKGEDAKAKIVMRYSYKVREDFDFPNSKNPPKAGDFVPWLDIWAGTPGTPIDFTYVISWPKETPVLQVGETLMTPKNGLPAITTQCSVEILYQESEDRKLGPSVTLIDPLAVRYVKLDKLPGEISTQLDKGKQVLIDLPPGLRKRVRYDPTAHVLEFEGDYDPSGAGEPLLLLNVMTEREKKQLEALSTDPGYRTAVNALHLESRKQLSGQKALVGEQPKALTAGFAAAEGYVTLAFQNDPECKSLSVSLAIIRVECPPYTGEIKVIQPDSPFDEALTLRHSGDFAGQADDYEFEWFYQPDTDGTTPPGPEEKPASWLPVPDNLFPPPLDPNAEKKQVDITIKGANILTLSDNWFVCRYKPKDGAKVLKCSADGWSEWTVAQLAPGWIKRVLTRINSFDQKMDNFHEGEVNTIVDMISQAGPRWRGNIALNTSAGNDFGLIEAYETVLRRGMDLSINAGINYDPANVSLLQAAGRLADLYGLLGNEAYGDAQDPTIAFGTDDGQYGSAATSIHCFMNQTDALLGEELELLRGRDETRAPGVETYPVYNRLVWNITGDIVGGEVAYILNYNIRSDIVNTTQAREKLKDLSQRAKLVEAAKIMYPQGHGDAWGHYLIAIKNYYRLLRHPKYTWVPRSEAVLVGGAPVTVDYLDERKFAKAAAAKARTGAEIVNLTYRQRYVENPEGQYQGYKDDKNLERAWGLSEWAIRAGQGAYFDWVVGNALLPNKDPEPKHQDIQKIDRTTVTELRDVASAFLDIQAELDKADIGLNPLGLATNVVPFDISPGEIDKGMTHFEQIYERSVKAVSNAITVFNYANQNSQLLRRQQDNDNKFRDNVVEREADFNNRLIEIFGYPYKEDIGAGGTYDQDYKGPDIYHSTYLDPSELMGQTAGPIQTFTVPFIDLGVDDNGGLKKQPKDVTFHLSTNGLGEVKPDGWTQRRAPGEIQMARSELLQARGRFEKALVEYDNLLQQIEDQAALLQAQYNLNSAEIRILNKSRAEQTRLNELIRKSRELQIAFRTAARSAIHVATAIAEFLPKTFGTANDVTAPARGALRLAGAIASETLNVLADIQSLVELDHQQAKEDAQAQTNIELTTDRQEVAIKQQIAQLEQLVRSEASLRLEIYLLQEAMQQTSGRYLSTLARGQRLLEGRLRFRQQTAAQVQNYRYKDMAFRIFRNDALQKYRAQFDMAAMYVYLAAKAYDYETNLLDTDSRAGQEILTGIIRQRTIGQIGNDGQPLTGTGLTDSMAWMIRNWEVLKPQFGFNDPQTETNRFSLRQELFRIEGSSNGAQVWREALQRLVVPNILDLPEFRRYCRPFDNPQPAEPGIVIPLSTNINFGINFFGWPLGGGDSAYDSSNFTTKVRSVGVWFTGYNNLGGGMSNTPRVYLIPVGSDVMRSPTGNAGETREWKILEQKLPLPFPLTPGEIAKNIDWIPRVDALGDEFAAIQRHSSFRAYHDSGNFKVEETINNSRLVGRSVWNTRWLLIIPAGTLHSDRKEGIERFINGARVGDKRDGNGVSDIKIFFQTYAYSGN